MHQTSPNQGLPRIYRECLKTQIWIAVAIYVLVAIVTKRLALDGSNHKILQILSLTLFEQKSVLRAFGEAEPQQQSLEIYHQMNLLDSQPEAMSKGTMSS